MQIADIKLLCAYNRWANGHVLDAAAALTPEELTKDLSTSHRSVLGTLVHIVGAEWIWLMRTKGSSPKALPTVADLPDLITVKNRWSEVDREQADLIDGLTEESLDQIISYTNTKGEQWKYPLALILQHVLNHSTYHRGQVIAMLRQIGAKPVMTDFLVYLDTAS